MTFFFFQVVKNEYMAWGFGSCSTVKKSGHFEVMFWSGKFVVFFILVYGLKVQGKECCIL